MLKEFYFDSCGKGQIHVCRWEPNDAPIAVFQIIHGIAEYAQRYDHFAKYLNSLGYLVVAEDHMGHGKSAAAGSVQGYFHGGWFKAVEDSYSLLLRTREEFPNLPYILFGHSMGSFMARTILQEYPDSGIAGCVICGTGWQPEIVLAAGLGICKTVCKYGDEKAPNEMLQKLIFGNYNNRVDHPRTPYDWLNRSSKMVDDYIADPMCGFTATAGLIRDMLSGISYIQASKNLHKMNKSLPVYFIAGGDDPVGRYGKGVLSTAERFQETGMESVSARIYPLCRHEILNEINREEIYRDLSKWMESIVN